jgi:nickel transport protein
MKQILMGGMVFGLVSSSVLMGTAAQAIPTAQILKKLQDLPVFTLTDKTGSPLIESDATKKTYTNAYLSPKDAQAALQKMQQRKPELVKQLQIRPVSLGEMYKLKASKKVDVLFVPNQSQVKAARDLNQNSSTTLEKFEGVPLFLGLAGQQPGYLTINQNKKQIIPLFFDREQLEPYLEAFKKNNPMLADTAGIQVLSLEKFMDALRSNNNPLYEKVTLMPSAEAMQLLRSSKVTIR